MRTHGKGVPSWTAQGACAFSLPSRTAFPGKRARASRPHLLTPLHPGPGDDPREEGPHEERHPQDGGVAEQVQQEGPDRRRAVCDRGWLRGAGARVTASSAAPTAPIPIPVARALRQAVEIDPRKADAIPSTKGTL